MVSQCREPLPIDMKDPLSGQTTAERASPNELGIGKGTNHPMPRQNASFTWTQTLRMPHVGEIAIQEMACRCAVHSHRGNVDVLRVIQRVQGFPPQLQTARLAKGNRLREVYIKVVGACCS